MKHTGRRINYKDLHRNSVEDLEGFWGNVANKFLHWDKPFEKAYDCQPEEGVIKWFTGGKLNVSGMATAHKMKPRSPAFPLYTHAIVCVVREGLGLSIHT